MRTVSFSPAPIRDELKHHFVCHRINTEGDPSAGRSHAHAPNDPAGRCSDGVANQNVQLLFLTPKGEIFHTVSGFRGPESLQQELVFAKTLFQKIRNQPEDARSIVQVAHRQRRPNRSVSPASRSGRSRSGGGGGGQLSRSLQYDAMFAQKYPLLPMEEFQRNPRLLVGNGSSMFVSGSATGGNIGG